MSGMSIIVALQLAPEIPPFFLNLNPISNFFFAIFTLLCNMYDKLTYNRVNVLNNWTPVPKMSGYEFIR